MGAFCKQYTSNPKWVWDGVWDGGGAQGVVVGKHFEGGRPVLLVLLIMVIGLISVVCYLTNKG